MKEILLQAIPNQSFTVNVNNTEYGFVIKETNGVMSATISRNVVVLLSNMRIVAGTPLIPYRYLQDGNFIITTQNGELPYYTEFNVTQFMFYASQNELDAIENGQ